jgi:mannose-6-phosphate isomerase
MTPFIQFKPIYQERVWGGRMLESFLGRKLPGHAPIGESWELVDRAEAQSQVSTGEYAGQSLRQLMEGHAAEIMGPAWPKDRPFPILVKWLDCRDRLSVQVHPPTKVAAALGGEPKTENWYMARTDVGAAVYAGLHRGVTRASFEQAIVSGTVEQCLDRLLVREGDSLLIQSGTMHAIDAGNVILEIQQNSDTTYRVYDWGRLGLDGKPRTLHVPQSLAALEANTAGSPTLVRGGGVLAQCREFTIRRQELQAGMQLALASHQQARILSVIRGELQGGGVTLRLGDNILLPYASGSDFTAKNDAAVLVTDGFSQA